jgi:hypothetical protein
MSVMSMRHEHEGGWSPVSAAPRDGTPVILWLAEDDAPPVLQLTVGSGQSSLKQASAIGGSSEIPPRFCSDRQIRGWKPGFTAEISNASYRWTVRRTELNWHR